MLIILCQGIHCLLESYDTDHTNAKTITEIAKLYQLSKILLLRFADDLLFKAVLLTNDK